METMVMANLGKLIEDGPGSTRRMLKATLFHLPTFIPAGRKVHRKTSFIMMAAAMKYINEALDRRTCQLHRNSL
jgi:hypothetical protein